MPGADTSKLDQCDAVAVDNSGNVFCAGKTTGSLGETGNGISDIVVIKFNSLGEFVWITQLGTVTSVPGDSYGSSYCLGLTVDASGNVYCAGATGASLGETNADNFDIFVMKLNSSGELVWLKQIGQETVVPGNDKSQNDVCNGIAVKDENNIYCAGSTSSSLGEANGGSTDVFILKLNSNGDIDWLKQLGSETVNLLMKNALES